MGACSAGTATLYLRPLLTRTASPTNRFDLGNLCNGILVGLVAVTGACDRIETWAAIVIGIASSFFFIGGAALVKKIGIDDPVEATAVHGFGGLCGIISVGLFDDQLGAFYPNEGRGKFFGY